MASTCSREISMLPSPLVVYRVVVMLLVGVVLAMLESYSIVVVV